MKKTRSFICPVLSLSGHGPHQTEEEEEEEKKARALGRKKRTRIKKNAPHEYHKRLVVPLLLTPLPHPASDVRSACGRTTTAAAAAA